MFAEDVYKLLERTADAAFVVTLEGEICFWNGSAQHLFGYTTADVQNKTCYEILQGKSALGTLVCTSECSVRHCAARTESIPTFDLEVKTRTGQRRWVSVSTIVFEDSRLHRRLIAHLASDISDRKHVEQAFSKMVDLSREIISVGDGHPRLPPAEVLSEQEERIMRLFAKAKNSRQVAKELGITLATLRNHLHAVNQKLHTHNRLEAVLHAMKRGLI